MDVKREYVRTNSYVRVLVSRGSSKMVVTVFKSGDLVASNYGFTPDGYVYQLNFILSVFRKGDLFKSDIPETFDIFD